MSAQTGEVDEQGQEAAGRTGIRHGGIQETSGRKHMEELGAMGMVEDTRDRMGGAKEEKEFVQKIRVWGKQVRIASQRKGA